MQTPLFSKTILPLGLALFLLPLVSLAFVSTGDVKCMTEDGTQVDNIQNDGTKDLKCQFDNQSGSNVLPLKWVIPGNIPSNTTERQCGVFCYRDDGKDCNTPDSGRIISGSNETLILSDDPTASGRDVFPEDAALVKKPEIGNIYQAGCFWYEGSWEERNLHTEIVSGRKTEVVGVPCEVPASSIFASLNRGDHTIITETDFKGWGSTDMQDNTVVAGSSGSGDEEDIKNQMNANQQCTGVLSAVPTSDMGSNALRAMKVYTDARQPTKMGLVLVDDKFNLIGYHAVIVLKITDNSNNNFDVRILDSENPDVYDMNCKPKTGADGNGGTMTALVCQTPDGYAGVFSVNEDKVSNLRQSFFNYCRTNSVSKFCQGRQNMTFWLENNYPNISNFIGTEVGALGVCSGWSDFVLQVAYLGEFVGTDFHPKDGKIVSVDGSTGCYENHYSPTPPAKSSKSLWLNPQNWLASLRSVIWEF